MTVSAIEINENVPLAPLTTLKVGGVARFFVRAKSEDEILAALKYAADNSLRVFILGGGSNILVSDAGFDGLVLQIALRGIETDGDTMTAGGGEVWDELVEKCVAGGLGGFECLSGIPGFVGATPIQNVGAYGQDVSETVTHVRVLDRTTSAIKTFTNAECGFDYRSSIFNTSDMGRYVVLAVTFILNRNERPEVRYADLKNYFAGKNETPSLRDIRRAVLAVRAKKSMVISPDDPNSVSAGSFFKNPVVSAAKFVEIQRIAERAGLLQNGKPVPGFPAADGFTKLPAAWLIENSGFHKGYVLGSAGISENHSLAIINRGGASAGDILALKEKIQTGVGHRFGIQLHPEPIFVGF